MYNIIEEDMFSVSLPEIVFSGNCKGRVLDVSYISQC